MIMKKTQPKKFDKNKYYVDMNELQHKSRSRLYYVFKYVVRKELKWNDTQLSEAMEELNRKVEFPSLLKAMNEYVKDIVVFYYGKGDDAVEYVKDLDPNKGMPKSKAVRKPRKKRKPKVDADGKTTQELFNERMREQVRKDYNLGTPKKRKKRKAKE